MAKHEKLEVEIESYQSQPSVAVASFFKGFRVPENTTFDLYKKDTKQDLERAKSPDYYLYGENDRLEYEGSAFESGHVVGVFDRSTRKLQLFKAPVVAAKVISKSNKGLVGPRVKNAEARGATLRNALGEAFGTKKAKKAISDQERNRIDSDKLTDVAMDIVDTVKQASSELPSRSDLQAIVSAERPTPKAYEDATDVEQIYPVESIIPKKELQYIRVSPIMSETNVEVQLSMFPYLSNPKYISKKLETFKQSSQTVKIQLLYYLSLLQGVFEMRRVNNKEKLLESLNSPPEVLIDGILDRFTVAKGGQMGRSRDRAFFISPQNEDKLLSFILTIILHLDNFIVEISPLAQDLGIKPSKIVTLYKALGATVKGSTVAQAEAFGIPKSTASSYKIATLKVPFKLPEITRRGRGPRR